MSRGEQWAGIVAFWRWQWSVVTTARLLRVTCDTEFESRARNAARRELRRRHVNYEVRA